MYYIKNFQFLIFVLATVVSIGQQNRPTGYFTSEANTLHIDGKLFLAIKKYNPTKEEIANAANYDGKKPMNYLMAPFEATRISLFNKGFESVVYCLDESGSIRWNKTIGYSSTSAPGAICADAEFIYTGEGAADKPAVSIYKLDSKGETVWQSSLDSLENLNAIHADSKYVTALTSFHTSKEVKHADGTFSLNTFPVYFVVRLDKQSGKLISKQYQQMGTYLSSTGFGSPILSDSITYYLSNNDSVIYLNTIEQKSGKVLNDNFEGVKKIVQYSAYPGQYEFLATESNKATGSYKYCIDEFQTRQKQTTTLPEAPIPGERIFIKKVDNTRYLFFSNNKNIRIYKIPGNGTVTKVEAKADLISPVLDVATGNGKIFIFQMEDRSKPGKTGKLLIKSIPL